MAKRYNILTRCLAALALLFVYVASTSAILVGGTTTSALARGGRGGFRGGGIYRGGGRGVYRGGRGYGRGYGYGFGAPLVVGPRCWGNPYGRRGCSWGQRFDRRHVGGDQSQSSSAPGNRRAFRLSACFHRHAN